MLLVKMEEFTESERKENENLLARKIKTNYSRCRYEHIERNLIF